jgi:two-component system cell cycle response regulator
MLGDNRRLAASLVGGIGWLVFAVHALVAREWAFGLFNDWVYDGLLIFAFVACAVRAAGVTEERAAWAALALGVGSWTAGDVYYSVAFASGSDVPFPSWADVGYLGFYPCVFVALFLLMRSRVTRLSRSVWVDALIAGFGAAALAASVLVDVVLKATDGTMAAVATNLAYPVGDCLLAAMVVGVFVVTNLRPGRAWSLLGAGLIVACAADSIYLVETATGSYREGTISDALWPGGLLLLAAAGWQPRTSRAGRSTSQALVVPGAFAVIAIALGVYDHVVGVNGVAAFATSGTLVWLLVRAGLAIHENRALLERSQRESETDALTGLGNRRRLTEELEDICGRVRGRDRGDWLLAIFDLDGFKGYNDRFGHPAGDALLCRLAEKLDRVTREAGGEPFRMGGDEFCVLLPAPDDAEATVARCNHALGEQGEGFAVTASVGTVIVPREATTPADALKVADQRLYANKTSSRLSALRQSTDVLVRVLVERQIELGYHVAHVAELAERTALALGLSPQQVNDTRLAAELHDIGKAAIPDAILNKPAPLSAVEWEFMRRHTIVGERIVAAAPALAEVGRIVRSSHERVDGSGYPDGLAGDEIPLPARIVAVSDAYDAMISDRPYAPAKAPRLAVEELRRCAGTHFDPAVVEAFADVLATVGAEAA